ncbi:MAG: DNRLRE domain-containing protein [Verrucomicrobia bacterium]|nr:DNRLRE domain-containing protein [Verrucomicrobiota bacterium]
MQLRSVIMAMGTLLVAAQQGAQGAQTYTFQQGVSGYDGTLDTQLRGGTPDRNDGNLGALSIDGSDGGGANHVVIRFEKLSGTGAGQIPPGSAVIEATLTLHFVDPGDDPALHRMVMKWDEATTWNSFDPVSADGVTPDGVEAATDPDVPAIEGGRTVPYFETVYLPVKTLQDWLDGKAPNYGWVFIPAGGGGLDMDSSEATVIANRPKLTIIAGTAAEASSVIITEHPKSVTEAEGRSVRFGVNHANNLGPADSYTYQWLKNGTALAGATSKEYAIDSVSIAENGAKISVRVSAAGKSATSTEATLTVTVDAIAPVLLSAKPSPNQTEVTLTFSEKLSPAAATAASNYKITAGAGSLNVSAAALSADGTKVTLTTAKQTVGTKYAVTVNNVADLAPKANAVAANSKAVFFAVGKIVQDPNGFIVFEAENYDRNLDDLWVKDTTRGNPSGGVSVVNPNGAGGSEQATKLEYDVEFKRTGTHIIWYRASGDSGSDDSAWFHLDGERPAERLDGNSAAMDGFNGALDFVWLAHSFGGVQPMSVDIATPGLHVLGLARREDGSFFDKFILTTDPAYTPTGFGPPETREGAPGLPTVTLSAPTAGQQFAAGANITLTATASGMSGLDIVRVEFSANGNKIGEAKASPFSFAWTNVKDGLYSITASAIDEIGASTTSSSVSITVGNPPPQALFVAAAGGPNASDTAIVKRLESQGWQVRVVGDAPSTTADAAGKNLIIISSTVGSGSVARKFTAVEVAVINWEEALQDELLLTTDEANVTRSSSGGQDQINIVKADHPLAAGLSTGAKAVAAAGQTFSWGVPAPNATIIAAIADDPTHAVIYAYEKGANLIDGSTKAPARRVHFLLTNDTFPTLNADGLKLFDAAVAWAANITVKPPTQVPTISLTRTAAGLNVTFTGTLQSADSVTGPWTDVANAKSPFTATVSGGAKFYRSKQ